MHVNGNSLRRLDANGGWSSGGFLGDSRVTGQVNSGSAAAVPVPQRPDRQLDRRELEHGVRPAYTGVPGNSFPTRRTPRSAPTPIDLGEAVPVRRRLRQLERVRARHSHQRVRHRLGGGTTGRHLAADQPVLHRQARRHRRHDQRGAGRRARTCSFTPGIYHLDRTINVTRPDTVVLGLGLATLVPDNGVTAISVADVNGVKHRGPAVRRRHHQLAVAGAGRPGRLGRGPRRRPDRAVRRVLPASAAPSVGKATAVAGRQQRQRDRRRHSGSGGPTTATTARSAGRQHRRQRPGRQRRQRHHVRPVRRALPAVPDALERQRRPDDLLPERDALRRAQPEPRT